MPAVVQAYRKRCAGYGVIVAPSYIVAIVAPSSMISGSVKRRNKPPGYDRFCRDVAQHEFDLVTAW